MILWPLLLLAILIVCSFVVSGSETALFALSPQEKAAYAASASRLKRLAGRLMRRPQQVLMTVLIVNTAVNVAIFAVSYVSLGGGSGSRPGLAAVGGAVTLLAVILFGEVVPKALALAHARRLAPLAAPVIDALAIATAPVRAVLRVLLVEPLVRLLSPTRPPVTEVSAEDLRALVQLSAEQEIISSREHDMLQGVVALSDITVRAIMVPRVEIHAVPLEADGATIRRIFRDTGHKKLPVYGRDLDDIRGLLYARDFYMRPGEALATLLRPVEYVPETINLMQLVTQFRRTRAQLAIAVDEYGGVSGLVALEDVLEEIVGQLEAGDLEPAEPIIVRLDERTYRLAGAVAVRSWRPLLGIGARFPQVDTIGGVVVAALGRMPRVGDTVRFRNLTITVDQLQGRRIARVIVRAEATPAVKSEVSP